MNLIGKYQIVERLGEGSMGVIYRAVDTVLDREVALKTLSTEGVQDRELLERFCREARACARLRHPNIVIVYDFGQVENYAFIAMELLAGSDLRRIIADGHPRSLEEKLSIMAEVCDGLQHAHSAGIIHRDLKPSNIFVGVDGLPRILDFGVAHMPASSLTVAGRVLGTPQYMSPEQILGMSCDGRSDVFSTAITAFEWIAGQHPFGDSPMERIVKGRPDGLLSINPTLSAELADVLATGLARKPDDRYSSAAEFASALRRAAHNTQREKQSVPFIADKRTHARTPGTQTILSAVLVNLQKFEDAADHGDLEGARQALSQMRQAGAEDTRYTVALKRSSERLQELEKDHSADTPTIATPIPQRAIPIAATAKAATGRFESTAMFNSPGTFAASLTKVIPEPPPLNGSPESASASPVRRSYFWFVLPLFLLICGAAVFLWTKAPFQTSLPLRPVAVAEVVSSQAPLFDKPDSGETAISVAHRGEMLQILRVPRFREQQWVEIQDPFSTRSKPVFARTADLGNWSSSDSALAQQLQQMFTSGSYVSLDPLDSSTLAPSSNHRP